MTNNGPDIRTISTNRPNFQTDRVMQLAQVKNTKEKTRPSHSSIFSFASRTIGPTCLDQTGLEAPYTPPLPLQREADPSAKAKEPHFSQPAMTNFSYRNIPLRTEV